MRHRLVRLAVSFVLFFALTVCRGGVKLSVSPSTVSNSYSGVVTSTVSGLNLGETIYLDRFLDLNSNLTSNASEPLTARFELTDGANAYVGGELNTAIPMDQDPTGSNVVVRFLFRSLDEAGRISGLHRFRVSSPSGRFLSTETSLIVTQAPTPHLITGAVFTVTGANPESNAVVTLLTLQNDFVTATVTDAKGAYKLYADAGEYRLLAAAAPGRASVGSLYRISVFTIASTLKLNITNRATTRTISGMLRNGNTGKGVPAIQILALSADGLGAVGYSDTNGTFSIPVAPGTWTLLPSVLRLGQLNCNIEHAPVVVDTAARSVSTNITFPVGSSLVSGSLSAPNGNPMPGIAMLGTNDLQAATRVITGASGEFAIGVTAAHWYFQPDPVALARSNYLSSLYNRDVPTNRVQRFDFYAIPATEHIHGRVIQDDGSPVSDCYLSASSIQDFTVPNGNEVTSATITRPDGTFDMPVNHGDWSIGANSDDMVSRRLLQPALTNFTVVDRDIDVDIVFRRITSKLTVHVQDTNGQGIVFATVNCKSDLDGSSFSVGGSTDWNGDCTFDLCNGTWTVDVVDLEYSGYSSPLPQQYVVSKPAGSVIFQVLPVMPMSIATTNPPPATVGYPYSYQLEAVGGTLAYIWFLAGGDLPAGLSLDSSGLISGIPITSTNASFTVVVQDAQSPPEIRDFTLLSAYPVALLSNFDKTKQVFKFQISGEVNRTYLLESAAKVTGPWKPFLTNRLTNPFGNFGTVPVTNAPVFYRARMDF